MTAYALRRTLMMIPMMLGITLISFFIISAAPGDPTEIATDLNPNVSAEAVQKIRALYHLDEPWYVQYWLWLKRVAVLDFGDSFSPDGRPVMEKINERLPVTLFINIVALAMNMLLAIPIGVIAATRPYGWFDKVTTLFVFLGVSAPTFWVALLLMILFGVHLGWLPISGLVAYNHDQLSLMGQMVDYARHLALPVLISGLTGLAFLSRLTRQNTLETLRADYIVTARAKGLPESTVLFKHSLRNALLPLVTTMGLTLPSLIGGSVIFESIFAIPGLGQLFYQGVMMRDYPLIMASLVIISFLTLVGNLLADLAYAYVDPRISYE
ncbi:MAG: ABC transporter permease [Nitrospinae bacterium]|nr:ABC transporter permease [Nitrospinota bacterium]